MADNTLNVITICGSLRKGSYNASLARTLPSLAPEGMTITPAPAWDKMPIYNHDIQAGTGFPADAEAWAARDPRGRRRHHRLAGIQLEHPGRIEERHRLGLAHEGRAVQGQAGGAAVLRRRRARRRAHAISLAADA